MAGRARGNFSSPSTAFPLSSGQTAGSLTGGGVGEGRGNLTGESSYPSQPVVWNSDLGEELKNYRWGKMKDGSPVRTALGKLSSVMGADLPV